MANERLELNPTFQERRGIIQTRMTTYTMWYAHIILDLSASGRRYSITERRILMRHAEAFKNKAAALTEVLDIMDGKDIPPVRLPRGLSDPIKPI